MFGTRTQREKTQEFTIHDHSGIDGSVTMAIESTTNTSV